MHQQIRLLAEQSGSTHKQSLGVYQFYSDELEKFAQLIIMKCAEVADIKINNSAGCGYITYTSGERIKEHFGVE